MRLPEGDPHGTRLHPATQLILLGCGLLLVYGVPSPVVPAAILFSAAAGAALSVRIRFTTWLLTLVVLAGPMLIMVGIIQGLFYPGEAVTILWEWGPAALTVEGSAVAVQLWLRVAAMIAVVALFALGSDAARVFDGMIALRLPLTLAYICSAAMSLLPLFRDQISAALQAKAARGWHTERLRTRLRLLPAVLGALVTTSLIQLDQRHDALMQRGFGQTQRPAPARPYHDGRPQRALRWAAPPLTLALVAAGLVGGLPLPLMSELLAAFGVTDA